MTLPTQLSPRVEALRKKMHAARGRLIFALDATASRDATWDLAMQLQASMFEEVARIGGLDMQLLYFRGASEVVASPWLSDAAELVDRMSTVQCRAGRTKIAKVLRHIQAENAREKVTAAIFVGDAIEELPVELYDVAAGLNTPLFVFQEGHGNVVNFDRYGDPIIDEYPLRTVEAVFRELARLSGGAYGRFNTGAAEQLGEMLRAVAAFAAGGITALADQNTDSARLLLGQLK